MNSSCYNSGMNMSSDLKRFPPNLSNCRSRKSSFDSRPCSESSSSSFFCLKNHEFTFGPDLQPQKRVKAAKVVPQSVKNSDIHFSSDMVLEEVGMEDDNFIHLARSIAEQNEGTCLSKTCESESFPLIFKCKLGHVWKTNEVLLTGSWCMKCKSLLDRAKHYASCFEGTCSNQICQILLDFECKNGHKWKADLNRYMYQKWCKQCLTDERNLKKIKILKDQQMEEEEQARIQEQLFAEARQKMHIESDQSVLDAEKDIENLAEDMAKRYIESSMISDPRAAEQVTCIYQVICSSEAYIKAKFFGRKTRDQATTTFRQMARLLHPDKNSHLYAAEAFQKLSAIYATFIAY